MMINMGWRRGYSSGRGTRMGPWPGRGPFSYLPPWDRPGWYGRGRGGGRGMCRWFFSQYPQEMLGYAPYQRYQNYGMPYSPYVGNRGYPYYRPSVPSYGYPYWR